MVSGNREDGPERTSKASLRKSGGAYEGALQAALAIVISMGFGIWADRTFDSSPIGLMIGVLIGFGAFTLRIWRLLNEDNPAAKQDSEEGPQGGSDP